MNDNKKFLESQTPPLFSVYVIWCRQTDMHYVGVTGRKVEQRIREHMWNKQSYIGTEIHRIGWEGNFDWWVVESHVPSNLISECEQRWIKFFDCVHPKGYNRTTGGLKFFKHTEEYKAKMSANSTGEKNPFYGKHHTDKAKTAMAFKQKGEKSHRYGKHHTTEAKEKNRQAHLGKVPWNKGIPHPDETKAKIGEAKRGKPSKLKGIPRSEETKAILRAKALARHAAKRAAKAVAEENLAAANSTPTSLLILNDAVIFQ